MSTELMVAANTLLGDTVPGARDLIKIGVSLAKTAEKIPGMKGAEKMDAVLSCLREILSGPIKAKLTAEEFQVLSTTIDTIVPTVITVMIDASRAGDFVKKTVSKKYRCVPCVIGKNAALEVVPAPAPAPVASESVKADAVSEAEAVPEKESEQPQASS